MITVRRLTSWQCLPVSTPTSATSLEHAVHARQKLGQHVESLECAPGHASWSTRRIASDGDPGER
jgi:hypothetical protein